MAGWTHDELIKVFKEMEMFPDDGKLHQWQEVNGNCQFESYCYQTDTIAGCFSLDCRPGWCDRGRVLAHEMTVYGQLPNLHHGWPRYFFSEDSAKQECESFVAAIKSLELESATSLASRRSEIDQPLREWQGSHCLVRLYAITNPTVVGNFLLTVQVKEEFQEVDLLWRPEVFSVTLEDLFPRYYYDLDVALTETEAWLRTRKQLPQGSGDKHA